MKKGDILTQDKVNELKRLIDHQLRSRDVYGQIRTVLSDFLHENHDVDVSSEEHVRNLLLHCNILGTAIVERKRCFGTNFKFTEHES
jgi:hypothetical protein